MSRASRWAERQKDEVQVDRPRFESVTVEAWVTDQGELAIWHKAVLGAKDAVMTPPETALALADWIDAIFCPDALDGIAWGPLDETPAGEPIVGFPLEKELTDTPPRKLHIDPKRWLPRGWSDPLCTRCGTKCAHCATPVDEPPTPERLGEPIQSNTLQSRLVEVGGQMRWVA